MYVPIKPVGVAIGTTTEEDVGTRMEKRHQLYTFLHPVECFPIQWDPSNWDIVKCPVSLIQGLFCTCSYVAGTTDGVL